MLNQWKKAYETANIEKGFLLLFLRPIQAHGKTLGLYRSYCTKYNE